MRQLPRTPFIAPHGPWSQRWRVDCLMSRYYAHLRRVQSTLCLHIASTVRGVVCIWAICCVPSPRSDRTSKACGGRRCPLLFKRRHAWSIEKVHYSSIACDVEMHRIENVLREHRALLRAASWGWGRWGGWTSGITVYSKFRQKSEAKYILHCVIQIRFRPQEFVQRLK